METSETFENQEAGAETDNTVMSGIIDSAVRFDPIGYAGGEEPIPVIEPREPIDLLSHGV